MSVGALIFTALRAYEWLILIRILLSWIRPAPPPGIVRSGLTFLIDVTDPPLKLARRTLPFLITSGLDLTPIAVLFALRLVEGLTF